MFRDKSGIVIQCINRKGMVYAGCNVPYMGLYGTFNGREFIAEPRLNTNTGEMRMKTRDLTKKDRWDSFASKAIVSHVIDAAKAGCIVLYKWDTKMVNPNQNDMKKESAFWHKEAANPDTIRRFKCKMKAQNPPMATSVYSSVSRKLYGEYIEINGRETEIGKIQKYMDGTGMSAGFDNSDRRPLIPQFPVKSYKSK